MRDTIYALSTGSLPSGVAVIRLSGPLALDCLSGLAGAVPPVRRVSLAILRAADGTSLDQALVLAFAGPESFTGEDCAEIHCHGGKATVAAILNELSKRPGLRAAEPGEFTHRAFVNGKLDLVEVEGLSDLLRAETEMQRRFAQEQSFGTISAIYGNWASRLTRIRAMVEADLDFSDEGDVPDSVAATMLPEIRNLRTDMEKHVAGAGVAEIIRDGFKIVIAGPPNAGKSSLLNAFAQRDVAIVSDIAGTTRDVVSVDLDLGGYKVTLSDTAGLRDSDDVIEREGIRRTESMLTRADLVLWLSETAEDMRQLGYVPGCQVIRVVTKTDVFDMPLPEGWLGVSAVTGDGFDSLVKRIREELESKIDSAPVLTPLRQRHVDCLRLAVTALDRCLTVQEPELIAEFLRQAQHQLGLITGRVDVEDLLGVIFSEFCIGK